jgi:hypothetical protein
MAKQPTSFRLSPEALALLAALAKSMGISQTSVIELCIRDAATVRNVKVEEVSIKEATTRSARAKTK